MTQRYIAWEKWQDPYGSDTDQAEWPGALDNGDLDDEDDDGYFKDEPDDDWGDQPHTTGHNQLVFPHGQKPTKILATAAGMIPLTEWTTPSKIFNFWTMHSNFRITEEIQDILDVTDGVESLDILTPYRCRISIGKIFDTIEVKSNILDILEAEILIDPNVE